MNVVGVSLLYWNTMLIDYVWLIHIEDLNMIGESFASYCKVTASKWTLSWNFKQFDVVADLCKVDFLVEDEGLSEKLRWFSTKSIYYQVIFLEEKLASVDSTALVD